MIKKVMAIALVGAMLFACGGEQDNNNSNKPSKKIAKAVDGKKIYQRNCVVCHGVYGDMGASGSFDLTTSKLSLEECIAVIAKGRATTVMVGFEDLLSAEEITAVAEYTGTLKK